MGNLLGIPAWLWIAAGVGGFLVWQNRGAIQTAPAYTTGLWTGPLPKPMGTQPGTLAPTTPDINPNAPTTVKVGPGGSDLIVADPIVYDDSTGMRPIARGGFGIKYGPGGMPIATLQ